MNPRRIRLALWAAGALLVAGLLAFLAVGANGPPDPTLEPPAGAGPADAGGDGVRTPVAGFGEIAFRLEGGGADGVRRCALLADTPAQQRQGLMGRRDLAGYDAMVFRFPADGTGSFFMRNVPMPLEIAWFDQAGGLVSTAEMAPCADRDGCPTYPPAGPYRLALEVEAGGLDRLGVGRSTVLVLDGACGAP